MDTDSFIVYKKHMIDRRVYHMILKQGLVLQIMS